MRFGQVGDQGGEVVIVAEFEKSREISARHRRVIGLEGQFFDSLTLPLVLDLLAQVLED